MSAYMCRFEEEAMPLVEQEQHHMGDHSSQQTVVYIQDPGMLGSLRQLGDDINIPSQS
jgi:hypothetical protein